MAKQRVISTKFWDDTYIIGLDPIEKLLFLYLLTTPLTNISGIYEITPNRIAFDTGIDSEMVAKILKRFEKDNKIIYTDNWLCVINFIKNQSLNPSVISGIERELKLIPKSVLKQFATACDSLRQEGTLNLTKLNLTKPNLTKLNEVYETYKEKINKGSILTDKAKEKVNSRLKVFTVEQLLQAIENFSKDSWWMEHNSSRGVAWFFHTDERIDGLINLKPREKISNKIE